MFHCCENLGVHAWPRFKEGLSLLRIIKIFLRIKKKNYTSVQVTADPFNTIVMSYISWSWRRGLAQSDMCPGGGVLRYIWQLNMPHVYTHMYKLYMPLWRVGFLCRFGLKIGMYFADFVLEKGMVFKGSMGVYGCIFIISIPNDCQRTKKRKRYV